MVVCTGGVIIALDGGVETFIRALLRMHVKEKEEGVGETVLQPKSSNKEMGRLHSC